MDCFHRNDTGHSEHLFRHTRGSGDPWTAFTGMMQATRNTFSVIPAEAGIHFGRCRHARLSHPASCELQGMSAQYGMNAAAASSSAPDPGHDVYLAVGRELRKPVVLVDLAVDCNRKAVVEVRGEVGEALCEPAHELAHVRGVHFEAALASP